MTTVPQCFISYSHDGDAHKDWVRALATRLMANGVDVLLDQWNLKFGSDLPAFMETIGDADRVIAVCSERYAQKANEGKGGVGYEKMILTADLLNNIKSEKIIPLLRSNPNGDRPTFLKTKLYVDFREDAAFEEKYTELIHQMHGKSLHPRPPIGSNPFDPPAAPKRVPEISMTSARYTSPALSGTVTFDYSNNDGRYVIGAGELAFVTSWSSANSESVHAYHSSTTPKVALIDDAKDIPQITDASQYDSSSRVRSPSLGEILVWQNVAGYWAATRIDAIKVRERDGRYELTFTYRIQTNKTPDFTKKRSYNAVPTIRIGLRQNAPKLTGASSSPPTRRM